MGLVRRKDEVRNTCIDFVGESDGKKPLGRPKRRCVNSVKIICKEKICLLRSLVLSIAGFCEPPCSTEFKDTFNQWSNRKFVKKSGIIYVKRKISHTCI
jgi:hypothetical protein